MLEIMLILIGVLIPLGLAKHTPRKRKFRAYIKGRILQDIDLGITLGSQTIVTESVDDSPTEKTFITSVVCSYVLSDWTPGANKGPIMFGWALSDYSDAEISLNLTQNTAWDRGDEIAQEVGKRKVRVVGTFDNPVDSGAASKFAEGRQVKTKLNWMLQSGKTIKFWAFNLGSVAHATTNPNIHFSGHANLWPTS